jgi:NADH dehydrogenase FAD-containing subunit
MSDQPSVVVIGGGYGGVNVAKALDDVAAVTLVEPRDTFQHNVAALRALVQPSWTHRIFLPYGSLLSRGTVVRDRAVEVDQHGVLLASGTRLSADYLVLATGSTYPFPAKSDVDDAASSVERYHAMYRNLERAERVLLLGAGPVGLELAGEIAAVWPEKKVTLVDIAETVLPGEYGSALREEIGRQLDGLGVTRVLGSPLQAPPEVEPGEVKAFAVTTTDGRTVEADIWFRCYGVTPVTGYLAGDLAGARTADGYLSVTPELHLDGFDNVYAVGDIVALDANKAGIAARQAAVVAANIRAAVTGDGPPQTYTPSPASILLPLGPTGGAGQRADSDELVPAEVVSQLKGADMMIDRFHGLLNLPTA